MSLLTRCPSCNEALNPTEAERTRGLCKCGGCGIEWPLDPTDNAKVDVEYPPEGFDLNSDSERFELSWPVLPLGFSFGEEAQHLDSLGAPRGGLPLRARGVALPISALALLMVGSLRTGQLERAGWCAASIGALLLLVLVLRPFRHQVVLHEGVATRTLGPFKRLKVAGPEVSTVEVKNSWGKHRVVLVTRTQGAHVLAWFRHRGDAKWFVDTVNARLALQR